MYIVVDLSSSIFSSYEPQMRVYSSNEFINFI